jgi:multisubunit Na+/H+ antiporter MnhE subunit
MILFANKHFSDKNIKLFSFMINCAIYFRAFLAILVRFIKKIILPLADFFFIYGGFLLIKNYWELSKFGAHGVFPDYFEIIMIPIYILIWLLSTNISGGYDKPIKPINLIKGVGFGTVFILIIYSLLREDLRVSRFLILIGAVWALAYLFLSRLILSKIKKSGIVFEKQAKKRIAIIGNPSEVDRVNAILDQTGLRYGERVFVDVDDNNLPSEKVVGNISQLKEIISVHKINELIFCAKDIETSKIIDLMSDLSKIDLEYKIAPEESVSIIGSNSINTSGELYVIDINSIIKPTNKRNKRTLDVIVSLIFFLFSPILIFVTHRRLRLYADIFSVLFAFKTWVGYYDEKEEYYSSLPKIKKGVLSPMMSINKEVREKVNPAEVNLLYAKNYKVKHDIDIILKGIKYI